MYKKTISILILIFGLTAFNVSADNSASVYSLTLQKAIDMAIEYSPQLECWEVNKKNLEIQLNSAKITRHENRNTPVYVSQNYDLIFVKEGYYVEAINSQIRLSEYEQKKIVSTIKYDVTQKYYNTKNASKMCEIASSALERAIQTREIINKQYELGLCTEFELRNAEIAVKQCNMNKEKCVNNLDIARDSLKIVLGLKKSDDFILTDEISYTNINTDMKQDIEKAINQRYDSRALEENVKLTQMYFEIVSGLSEKSTTYYSAYTNKIEAQHNLITGKSNIELLIKNLYYSVTDAINNTDISKDKLDYAKTNYEINKIRYELGMITGIELMTSSDELTSAENAYENALLSQKLAIEKYNYEVLIGIQ